MEYGSVLSKSRLVNKMIQQDGLGCLCIKEEDKRKSEWANPTRANQSTLMLQSQRIQTNHGGSIQYGRSSGQMAPSTPVLRNRF